MKITLARSRLRGEYYHCRSRK